MYISIYIYDIYLISCWHRRVEVSSFQIDLSVVLVWHEVSYRIVSTHFTLWYQHQKALYLHNNTEKQCNGNHHGDCELLKALLYLPIVQRGAVTGFIGFEKHHNGNDSCIAHLSAGDLRLLERFGNQIGDYNDREEVKQKLMIAKEVADSANRAKSEFTSEKFFFPANIHHANSLVSMTQNNGETRVWQTEKELKNENNKVGKRIIRRTFLQSLAAGFEKLKLRHFLGNCPGKCQLRKISISSSK